MAHHVSRHRPDRRRSEPGADALGVAPGIEGQADDGSAGAEGGRVQGLRHPEIGSDGTEQAGGGEGHEAAPRNDGGKSIATGMRYVRRAENTAPRKARPPSPTRPSPHSHTVS